MARSAIRRAKRGGRGDGTLIPTTRESCGTLPEVTMVRASLYSQRERYIYRRHESFVQGSWRNKPWTGPSKAYYLSYLIKGLLIFN